MERARAVISDQRRDAKWGTMWPHLLAAAEASGLANRYAADRELLELYMRKLLKPGWAGTLDVVEKTYVRLAKALLGIHTPIPPREHRFRGAR